MQKNPGARLGVLFFIVFMVFIFASPAATLAADVNLIRNGSFSSGLSEWVVNPDTGESWNPLSNGAVNLHPLTSGYTGTIIHQNLNVTGIGGTTVNFQARLTTTTTPPAGNTIAFYLTFVDTANAITRVKILSPDNSAILMDPTDPGSLFTVAYVCPVNVRKLVKIEVAKEDYGQFYLDDISLTTGADVIVGALPTISGLSSSSGAYQSSLTITGANFGAATPVVKISGSATGVTVTSASATSIVVTIQDPARSGQVCVIADYVESNSDLLFDVTSPNYTVGILEKNRVAVKGQIAEFVFRLDFLNGFTTQNGVNFTIQGLPQGTPATFLPIPLKNKGGGLLKIDTTLLAAGIYPFVVQAVEANTAARIASGSLEVVTITDIRFFETVVDSGTGTSSTNYLTSKAVTAQDGVTLSVDAVDSRGKVWTTWDDGPISLTSSSPSIVGVYNRAFGPEIYALQTGATGLVATTSDGYTETLPLTVTIASPKVTSISLSPSSVYNTSTGDINFAAQADGTLSWTGYDSSGMMGFDCSFLDNLDYASDNLSSWSTFTLLNPPVDLGMVLFYTTTGTSKLVTPLYIVSDPALTELSGGIRLLDDTFAESFLLEFYNPADDTAPVLTREIFAMHGEKNFRLGGITPGTYKLRLSHEGDVIMPQWYPNADSFSTAVALTLNPGLVDNIYFFTQGYPTISFSGSVKDGVNNYPATGIENAAVQVVDNGSIYKSTDTNGDFKLTGIRAGNNFELNITKTGFTPVYSEIFSGTKDVQALLPYALVPDGTLAAWGNTTGTGAIVGRAAILATPGTYLSGATVTAVNQADTNQSFAVTYQDPDTKAFGGSATYDNGVFAVLNVPADVTVTLTAEKSGWTFAWPKSWVKTRADAICETSFFGISVDEPAIRSGFESAMAAFAAGNVSGFMAFVSADYLDDGMDRAQFEAEISQMIQAGESMAYVIQSIVINGDQALINIIWNGSESETLYFKKEGTDWLMVGNQQMYEVSVHSGHTSTSYWVGMTVDDENNTIASVSVAGPGITGTIALEYNAAQKGWTSWHAAAPYGSFGPEFGTNPPAVPLTYTFTITQGQEVSSVTAVMNNFVNVFAIPGYPAVNQAVLSPTSFSWTGVEDGYTYGVELNDANGARLWNVYDITGTSAAYTGPALVPGSYYYSLQVMDGDENFSMVNVPFSVTPARGDVNADGKLNLEDGDIILKVLTGSEPQGLTQVTGDPIEMQDAIQVLQTGGDLR
jgi:hypothetical protein